MVKSVVSEGVKSARGSKNNFTNEFQAEIQADLTVLNKSKMVAMCTLCILR